MKSGAVRGYIRREQVQAAQIRIGDRAASAEEAAKIVALLDRSFEPVLNREICIRYRSQGDHLIASATIDGQPDGLPSQR